MTEETTVSEYVLRDGPSLMDVLRQAEADHDAYAAVLRSVMRRAKARDGAARCWDCGSLNRLGNHDADCIALALDALTDEQKERIT